MTLQQLIFVPASCQHDTVGKQQRWYQATTMWAVSSELPVHHCFPSLFNFLLLTLSNTKVQSPGEISQPTVVRECV